MNHSQVWIGFIRAFIPESNPKLAFRNGCIIAKLRIGLVYIFYNLTTSLLVRSAGCSLQIFIRWPTRDYGTVWYKYKYVHASP